MNNIWVIAKNTYKETIRDRLLYTVTFLGFIYLIFTFFLSQISLDQGQRVVTDFGLAGILFFGIFISIFIGANLLYKEFISGTGQLLFPKPLSRSQYIIGKFFGISLTLLVVMFLLTLLFSLGYFSQFNQWPNLITYQAILASYLEILIISALALMFGVFTSPIASSLYSIALFFIGHSFNLILSSALQSKNVIFTFLIKTAYFVLPNLEKFNLRNFGS